MEKTGASVGLKKKQICFLDKMSKNCRFSGGRKLRRTSIMRAILKAARDLDIDVSGVRTEGELENRVLLSFRQIR